MLYTLTHFFLFWLLSMSSHQKLKKTDSIDPFLASTVHKYIYGLLAIFIDFWGLNYFLVLYLHFSSRLVENCPPLSPDSI